jgi:hypothetical protein
MYQNLGGKVAFAFPFADESSPPSRNWKLGASVAVPLELTSEITLGGLAVVD